MKFQRLVGAAADVKELEYIIALHQTCLTGTRENATVSSTDVRRLLKSRHGLTITHEQSIQIVKDLGGGDDPIVPEKEVAKPMITLSVPKLKGINMFLKKSGSKENDQDDNETLKEIQHNEVDQKTDADNGEVVDEENVAKEKVETETIDKDEKNVDEIQHDEVEQNTDVENGVVEDEENLIRKKDETEALLSISEVMKPETELNDFLGSSPKIEEEAEQPKSNEHENNEDRIVKATQKNIPKDLDTYLDLVQIFSIIMIPTFARTAHEFKNGLRQPPEILEPKGCFARFNWNRTVRDINQKHLEYINCRPMPDGVLERDVRTIMLTGIQSSSSPPMVDEEFVRALLMKFGEIDKAENPKLIREMVQAAKSKSGLFDEEAFTNAVSGDLVDFKVGREDDFTTFFEDVFDTFNPRKITELEDRNTNATNMDEIDNVDLLEKQQQQQQSNDDDHKNCKKQNRLSCSRFCSKCFCCVCGSPDSLFKTEIVNIDMVLDAHGSLYIVVLIWVFFIFSSVRYGTLILAVDAEVEDNCVLQKFWCMIIRSVYDWAVVGVVLSIFGFIMMVPMGAGNNAYYKNPFPPLFSMFVTLIYSIVPFLGQRLYKENVVMTNEEYSSGNNKVLVSGSDGPETMVASEYWDPGVAMVLAFGLFLSFIFFIQTCAAFFRIGYAQRKSNPFFASSNARSETMLKWAAFRKVNAMISNAYALHTGVSNTMLSASGQSKCQSLNGMTMKDVQARTDKVMRNFVLYGEHREESGGIFWTWKKIVKGELLASDGIWINTRLIVMQAAQIVAASFLSAASVGAAEILGDQAESAREELMEIDVPDWVMDIFPTKKMVTSSLYPAAFVTIYVMWSLVFLYIPSAVATVMKYRCQICPSLGSPYFQKYRKNIGYVYMNSANGLWGLFGAGVMYYYCVGLIIFLFQWDVTKEAMLRLLTWGIGLAICIILKKILTSSCASVQYRVFYRIKPIGASFLSLGLECWYIGLGGSVLIGRLTQFLLASLFWIGRIDVPFLSEDVCLFGYSFDYVPTNFVKDLLLHEAHRHPFLERLAQIYLMKLRYKRFGTAACAVWRQLALLSLFPWLTKYRVFSDVRIQQAMESRAARLRETQEEEALLGINLTDDAKDAVAMMERDFAETAEFGVKAVDTAKTAMLQGVVNLVSPSSELYATTGQA